jgi:hypothetical protein
MEITSIIGWPTTCTTHILGIAMIMARWRAPDM